MDSQADQQGVCVLGAGVVVWEGGGVGRRMEMEMDGVAGGGGGGQLAMIGRC